jgi:hypothetical protein
MTSDLPEKWPRTLSEAQKVVDAIRFRLQSENQTDSPESKELAKLYAILCRRCNDRLREAESLIKQGNLAQALQTCEIEPRLLDLVSLVELPERPDWMQLVVLYDWDEPEPVLMDIGEKLNEAYTQGASIDTLLTRHRLLALARAPLLERARVLRALKNHDSASPHWVEDLRELESAWLREAERDIQEAFTRRDAGSLQEIAGHLKSGELLEEPPERLVKLAGSRLESLVRANARKILETVAVRLDEAFAAMDRSRALTLRSQWMQQSIAAKLPQDDPLLRTVSPALNWLSDGDSVAAADEEFSKAVRRLQDAIASPATSMEDLVRTGERLSALGREIPRELRNAYQSRLAAGEARSLLRKRLIIGSVAGGLLVVCGLIAFTVSAYRNARAFEAILADVDGMLGKDDLAGAEVAMGRLAGYGSSPERKRIEARFAELQSAEKSRRARVEAGIAEARAPGLTAEKALAVVKSVAALARPGMEKDEVAALEKEFQGKVEADRLAADTEVKSLCTRLDDQLKALGEPRPVEAELNRVRNALEETDADFTRLQTVSARASSGMKDLAATASSRRRSYTVKIEQTRKKLRYFAEMDTQSLIDPVKPGVNPKSMLTAWEEARKRYATEFPDDALSRNDGLSEEVQLWSAALEASRLIGVGQSWIPQERWAIDTRAKSLAERSAALDKVPEGAVVREYQQLLASALKQHLGSDGSQASGARAKLRQLLEAPLIRDTYLIVMANKGAKNSYYLSEDAARSALSTRDMQYIVGNGIANTKKKLILTNVVSDAELKTWKLTRSPQAAFAADHLPAFDDEANIDWLDATEAMAKALITHPRWEFAVGRPEKADKGNNPPISIDPMLRFLLLRSILQYAGEGHSLLRDELLTRVAVLDDPDLNLDALWMDPENTGGIAARSRAEARLNQAKPILEAWPGARRREEALKTSASRSLRSIGWISRGNAGTWEVRTLWKPEPGWVVEVMFPADSGSAKWIQIGPVGAGGELPALASRAESLLEGRMVFIRSKTKN